MSRIAGLNSGGAGGPASTSSTQAAPKAASAPAPAPPGDDWWNDKFEGPAASPQDAAAWQQRAQATQQAMDQNYRTPVGLYDGVDFNKQKAYLASQAANPGGIDPLKVWDFTQPASSWALSQAAAGALDEARITGDYTAANQLLHQIALCQQSDGSYAPNLAFKTDPNVAALAPTVTQIVRSQLPFGMGNWAPFQWLQGGVNTASHQNVGFDDNAWIGLDFMQAYRQTGNAKYLSSAKGAADFLIRNIDPESGLILEFQGTSNHSENAVSTGPALQLALYCYQETKDPKYLDAAKKMYAGLNQYCKDSAGLYHGGYDMRTGKVQQINPSQAFSPYDTGTMIGANVAFYQVTGDPQYLQQAQQTAKASIAKWGAENGNGVGGKDGFNGQRPRYNAIFFRELMKLNAIAPDPSYTQALQAYGDHLWNDNRDPKTGLFTVGTPGASDYYPAGYDITDQGACEQIFGLLGSDGGSFNDVG